MKASSREKAKLLLRLRELELAEQEEQAVLYDWYADSCPCGVKIGQCRTHPRARPDQRPPGYHLASKTNEEWRIWLIDAGRGFGKTRSAAEFVTEQVKSGRVQWVGLVNETVKDVRDVMIEHPYSGLIKVAPPWFKPIYEPSKARVTWPNGAYATIYSAEQPRALRGPGFGLAWCDEIAKWKLGQQETWDNLEFCLREVTDPRPRVVVTTTPRPTKTFKSILSDPRTVVTGGSMYENRNNLDPDFLVRMEQKYQGTRLGRQELHAELLTDNPGALWDIARIDRDRRPRPRHFDRIVIAVDPAGSIADMARVAAGLPTEDDNDGDDAGIVAAGRAPDGHGYVLADATTAGSPALWGRAAVDLYHALDADLIVAERNHGGENVARVIRSVDDTVPVKLIHASRGKRTRAEPVASLYEQARVHHTETFPQLEDELTNWSPGMDSPNRMDALVFCISELMLDRGPVSMNVVDDPFNYGGRRW